MVRTCIFTLYNISNSSKYKIIFYQKKKSSPFLGRNMSFNLITPEIANKCSKKKDSQNEIIYVRRFNISKIGLLGKILFKFQ